MANRSTFFSQAKQALIRFSRLLAKVQTAILLTLFYYLILGPFALLYKLLHARSSPAKKPSYWIKRQPEAVTKANLMKQY